MKELKHKFIVQCKKVSSNTVDDILRTVRYTEDIGMPKILKMQRDYGMKLKNWYSVD